MVFVYTTCANVERAKDLGKLLVEKKMAACVDFWPVGSMYYWKGELKAVSQAMLLVTTLESKLAAIEDTISANHGYSAPLIAGVDVRRINHPYKTWMSEVMA